MNQQIKVFCFDSWLLKPLGKIHQGIKIICYCHMLLIANNTYMDWTWYMARAQQVKKDISCNFHQSKISIRIPSQTILFLKKKVKNIYLILTFCKGMLLWLLQRPLCVAPQHSHCSGRRSQPHCWPICGSLQLIHLQKIYCLVGY